jgi:hypothetical protein
MECVDCLLQCRDRMIGAKTTCPSICRLEGLEVKGDLREFAGLGVSGDLEESTRN